MAMIAIREGESWFELPLGGDLFRIGRDQKNDYAIEKAFVSRFHCELFKSNNCWYVRDLGSTLGTKVNGMVAAEQMLSDGDVITLGQKFEICFRSSPDRSQQQTVRIAPPVHQPQESNRRLVALNGPLEAKTFPLQEPIIRLGRNPSCEIHIHQDTISQFHAELITTDDGLVLADLNSSNGTYINDRRIHRQILQPGDKLRLDWVEFRFEDKNYSVSNTGTRIRGNLLKELTIDGDDRDSQAYPELQPQGDFAERVLVRDRMDTHQPAGLQPAKTNRSFWWVLVLLAFLGGCFGVWTVWGHLLVELI